MRIHLPRLRGTGISRAHISATSVQPNWRAARAGNSASRSSVTVKITLATSSAHSSLRVTSNCSSSVVAESISARVLHSTVVAPLIPRKFNSTHPFSSLDVRSGSFDDWVNYIDCLLFPWKIDRRYPYCERQSCPGRRDWPCAAWAWCHNSPVARLNPSTCHVVPGVAGLR
jgi:hypothetical protein